MRYGGKELDRFETGWMVWEWEEECEYGIDKKKGKYSVRIIKKLDMLS